MKALLPTSRIAVPLLLLLLTLRASSSAATVQNDVEFARAGDVSLTLDASVPDGAGPFPAVIVVHGGGYTKGDKRTYVKPLFPVLTDAGFAWFTINYRLAPQYPFPAAADDLESAIRFVKSNAKRYKIDPRRIALVGESAGGYLVNYVASMDKPASRVAAVVSFYGPADLVARLKQQGTPTEGAQAFFGVSATADEKTTARLRAVSPIMHAHRGMPPFLFIHGTKDQQVPYEQSPLFCNRMKEVGASCEVYTVEGAGHGIEGWEKNPEWQGYKQKMVQWLKEKLAAPKAAS